MMIINIHGETTTLGLAWGPALDGDETNENGRCNGG